MGYGLWVIGYWLWVIGYWLLVVGYWLLVIGCWLLVVRHNSTLPQLVIGKIGNFLPSPQLLATA
jgi:hypothetical protein